MPPTFTTILAEHLSRAANCPAREAEDGETIAAGRIYLAPGGRHMRSASRIATPVIALDDGPLINFCRPAVDPMFSSAAAGMGRRHPGRRSHRHGLRRDARGRDIVAAGGSVIAQDEATSVVWGMPGAAAQCRGSVPRCFRSTRSRRRSCGCFPETGRDAARLRLSPQAVEGALRPDAVGRKQYLVESRLRRWRARPALRGLGELVAKLQWAGAEAHRRRGRSDDDQRVVLLPRQDPVRAFPRCHHAGADGGARAGSGASASGARPPRPARSPIRWP